MTPRPIFRVRRLARHRTGIHEGGAVGRKVPGPQQSAETLLPPPGLRRTVEEQLGVDDAPGHPVHELLRALGGPALLVLAQVAGSKDPVAVLG